MGIAIRETNWLNNKKCGKFTISFERNKCIEKERIKSKKSKKLMSLWVRLTLKFRIQKIPATKIFNITTEAVNNSFMFKVSFISIINPTILPLFSITSKLFQC